MPRVRSRAAECLLALLVLRNDRIVNRSWLAGNLWPDSVESQALQNLRHALLLLRKAFGTESERFKSPTRDTLTLDLAGADVDVLRFDACMRQGTEAALLHAVETYKGVLLEGFMEEWVFLERDVREQSCLRALEFLAEAAEKSGKPAEALDFLRKMQRMNMLNDTTQRAFMRSLVASGDVPAALASYRDYRILLRTEMNADPDQETINLYQQIRADAKQAGQQKEAMRQYARPELSVLAGVQSFHSPLPHPLTALLGREQETSDIVHALSNSRLVTLVGGGGVGKTRLAIHAAGIITANSDQKTGFVELAALTDPALLPAFAITALKVSGDLNSKPDPLLQVLIESLSLHNVLLVLDNCEHLIEAVASLTKILLERCPNLRVLCTSRQRLGLIGEVTWRVPSLSSPNPAKLAEEVHGSGDIAKKYPAVQLFVERAAMARPGFQLLNAEDVLAVAHICQRLDGIPLAIELAAARVGTLSVVQIASRLDDRFRLLTGGSRTALPRQQTLYALISWSYELLSEHERILLCRFSVFTGGWTLQAAESIAELKDSTSQNIPLNCLDALEILGTLIDKSLVLPDENRSEVRYRMLETVREFAREKLRESEMESAARNLHLAYFLEKAQTSAQKLATSDPEPAVEFLESEVDNYRTALAWAHSSSSESYIQMAAALWPFWEIRGYLSEGRTHLQAALNATPYDEDATRAEALRGATILALSQSDVEQAIANGEQCLECFRMLEDLRGMSSALLSLGEAQLIRQDFVKAIPLLREGLNLSRSSDWQTGTILFLSLLGKIYRDHRDMDLGRTYMKEALDISELLGDPRMLARTYRDLGVLEIAEGNFEEARSLLEKSLEIRTRLGDRMGIAYTLGCLGDLEKHGSITRAIAYCQQEMKIYQELGNAAETAHAMHRLGNLYYWIEDYNSASKAYTASLDFFNTLHSEAGFAYIRMNLGSALFHLGQTQSALKLYCEALSQYLKAGNEEGILWALERIGVVEAFHGDMVKATHLIGSTSIMRERLGIPQTSFDKKDWEMALDRLRKTLIKPAFRDVYEEGCAMTKEEAILLAVKQSEMH